MMLFESRSAEMLYYILQRFADERSGFLDFYIKNPHDLEDEPIEFEEDDL